MNILFLIVHFAILAVCGFILFMVMRVQRGEIGMLQDLNDRLTALETSYGAAADAANEHD